MATLHTALTGRGRFRTYTAGGRLCADTGWRPNQVLQTGGAAVIQWLTGTNNTGYQAVPPPSTAQLGTGTCTAAPTDTGLCVPAAGTLVPVSQQGPTSSNPLVGFWIFVWGGTAGSVTGTFTEALLASAAGTPFAHLTGLSVTLSSTTTTTLEWQWTITI